jgi:hypothetical protein
MVPRSGCLAPPQTRMRALGWGIQHERRYWNGHLRAYRISLNARELGSRDILPRRIVTN